MDESKICFIICSNDAELAQEASLYINHLTMPENFTAEIMIVTEAKSMTSGYNEAMRASNAKYKVYLHHDVLIIHRNFINDMIKVFQSDARIGMLGVVGSPCMPENGCMWSGDKDSRIGWALYDVIIGRSQSQFARARKPYQEAVALDGMLMATQYDLPWRDDLFLGWDFYDCSQALEFWRNGYKVVVPHMEQPWCMHDNDGILKLENYDRWRKVYLEEYKADFLRWNAKHGGPN